MKNRIILLFCSCFLISSCAGLARADDYRLCPGDLLSIGVYGYEELQVQNMPIRPDGKLAFPLVGEIQAAGLTPADLSAKLTQALEEYVKNPQVTINIVKFHTIRVYVLGEVNHPGAYELEKEPNLLAAIGMAGGYTRYAVKRSVHVVHKATGQYVQANLDALLKKGDLTQNYELGEGDVVYLTRNGISFVDDVLPYISALYQIKMIVNQ
ncbi:MAG TPA: polysaccharide biosynthesis/export family protein [Bacillota bacterium]|nr:polysaccharide biosynthesis/export family protein [Bacillota bacterium]